VNTNDLPPAAKLAALIEAGRAANRDLYRSTECGPFLDGCEACAMGFAALGAGVTREELRSLKRNTIDLAERLGFSVSLCSRTAYFNDYSAESLDQVIHSLREGELAKVTA
jgi:hypothetical protein